MLWLNSCLCVNVDHILLLLRQEGEGEEEEEDKEDVLVNGINKPTCCQFALLITDSNGFFCVFQVVIKVSCLWLTGQGIFLAPTVAGLIKLR